MAKRTALGPIARPVIPQALEALAGPVGDGDVIERHLLDADTTIDRVIGQLDVIESRLVGCRFTGADITGCIARDVAITEVEWSGIAFHETRWLRVSVADARLSGFTAPAIKLEDVVFTSSRLDGASFRGAVGERVAFVDCDLSDADFTGTKLTGCTFVRCDLRRADFAGATLRNASLGGSNVEGVRGTAGLAGVAIDSGQVAALAQAALEAMGIRVDDDDVTATTLLGGTGHRPSTK